jgi:hypothetical protein
MNAHPIPAEQKNANKIPRPPVDIPAYYLKDYETQNCRATGFSKNFFAERFSFFFDHLLIILAKILKYL